MIWRLYDVDVDGVGRGGWGHCREFYGWCVKTPEDYKEIGLERMGRGGGIEGCYMKRGDMVARRESGE